MKQMVKKYTKIHSRFRDGKILGELMWKKEKCRIQLQQEHVKNKKSRTFYVRLPP